MDPILLTLVAVFYFVTKGKIASKAYDNGKEPPGVAKARMRHESAGGGRTPAGRPKGKGAFRLMLASRWADVCDAAQQRSEHNARRQRAWYDETAPQRDAAWREAQERKMERRELARRGWAKAVGLVDPVERARRREDEAWAENQRRDHKAASTTRTPETSRSAPDNTSNSARAATPDNSTTAPAGCVWIWPRGETCGQGKQDGSPYCATHTDSARSTTCLWANGNPDIPQCGSQREEHKPFCSTHQAEYDRRISEPSKVNAPQVTASPAPSPPAPSPPAPAPPQQAGPPAANGGDSTGGSEPIGEAPELLPEDTGDEFSDEEASDVAEPTASTTPSAGASGNPTAPTQHQPTQQQGSSTVYLVAVKQLVGAADQVAQFRSNLGAFGDTLAGKKWGQQVVGPIADMDAHLVALEGTYRDLAGQVQHQGSQGQAAYDQAPYVPGPEAVLVP